MFRSESLSDDEQFSQMLLELLGGELWHDTGPSDMFSFPSFPGFEASPSPEASPVHSSNGLATVAQCYQQGPPEPAILQAPLQPPQMPVPLAAMQQPPVNQQQAPQPAKKPGQRNGTCSRHRTHVVLARPIAQPAALACDVDTVKKPKKRGLTSYEQVKKLEKRVRGPCSFAQRAAQQNQARACAGTPSCLCSTQ